MEAMEPKKIEGTPFAEKLQDSQISEDFRGEGKLNEIQSLPGKIIRAEKFSDLKEIYPSKYSLIEIVQTAKKLYREIEEKYGVSVPADFMIGKNDAGEDVVYSVVDKIEGENLYNVNSSSELSSQAETLYSTLAKYYMEKLRVRGFYLSDIFGLQQYVYGRKQGEMEDKIYLVDTDMFISDSPENIYLIMKWLSEAVVELENILGVRFDEARESIFDFITQPIPDDFNYAENTNATKHITSINRYLNKGSSKMPQLSSFE